MKEEISTYRLSQKDKKRLIFLIGKAFPRSVGRIFIDHSDFVEFLGVSIYWHVLVYDRWFLTNLYDNCVRLTIESNLGVPYYYYVRNFIGVMELESIIEYIYDEYINPTYKKEYVRFNVQL